MNWTPIIQTAVVAIAIVGVVAIFGNTMIHLMVNVEAGDAPLVIMSAITVFGTLGGSVTGIKIGESIAERRAAKKTAPPEPPPQEDGD